ncbi:DUF3137 domain-containing protein [Virgibacillus salinus]|uniref:DUF3137 domain-containing protein n=1 Tax=Virgibacillus salinus TaxID=553311 RepID=A0A1H1EMV8_9BACI|nr:DUF3137 domain-containing protein [Virgibacillus salinus]SDQ89898.1 Protein of unknown function [Virgibacillus salinus]
MKKISKTREEFDQFYEEEIKGEIEELEANRKNLKKRRNKQAKITTVAALIPILLGLIFSDYFIAFFIATFVVLIIGFSKMSKTYKSFEGVMKKRIVRKVVTFINPEFQYAPEKHIPKETFLDTRVFPKKPDKYLGDDLIWGSVYDPDQSETEKEHELSAQNTTPENIKQVTSSLERNEEELQPDDSPKTDIAFSEVTAIDTWSDTDGHQQETVIFQGLFFDVDFNKDFQGTTVIAPRKDLFFDFKKLDIFHKQPKLEEIELDNVEFNERFAVKTTDEVKARYILTPGFMEKMLALADGAKERSKERIPNQHLKIVAKTIEKIVPYFSFKDGKMYFLLNTLQDHFEFNIDKKADKESIYNYFEDINQALMLVEELDLNLKLWNKA